MAEINVGVTQTLGQAVEQVTEILTAPNLNLLTTSHNQTIMLADIITERNYQDMKWGAAFERANMTMSEWIRIIGEYSRGEGRAANYSFETRMVKAAAIAVAAVEWQKRQIEEGNPVL